MIPIHSQTQLTLVGFETPFERSMDKNNRWVKLSACIPWDDLADAYYQSFNASTGRPAKDAQLVICAVITNINSSSVMKKLSHKSRKIRIYNTFAA
jgi:hypothetical protein